MCTDDPLSTSSPPLRLSFCFETKSTLCTERAEFGRLQIRDSERLVMIRGSNWVMGSKDAHLFPGLLIQTERKKEAQRHGGGWHTHLQNIGLRETIDQSYNEFPEKCAEKMCAHHWLYTKTYHRRASHKWCQNKPPGCWLQNESEIPPALRWERLFLLFLSFNECPTVRISDTVFFFFFLMVFCSKN